MNISSEKYYSKETSDCDRCDTYVNWIESIKMFYMRRHEDHG